MCVRERQREFVCVSVCVSERETDREKIGGSGGRNGFGEAVVEYVPNEVHKILKTKMKKVVLNKNSRGIE